MQGFQGEGLKVLKNRVVLRHDFQASDIITADEISFNFDDVKYTVYYKSVFNDGSKKIYLKDTQPDFKSERALFHIKSFLKAGYRIIEKRLIDDILGL